MGFLARGVIDHMCLFLNVFATDLAQEMPEHRCDGATACLGIERTASQVAHMHSQFGKFLQGRAVARSKVIGFSQADDAARARDTHTFLQECWPGGRKHESGDSTSIDQVERGIWKVKRLQSIHYLETRIFQFLDLRAHTSVLDHGLADVNPYYLDVRVLKSHVQHPATRTTGNIQYTVYAAEIGLLGEHTAHRLRGKLILTHQSRHFGGAFGIYYIGTFILGLPCWC